MEESTDGSEAVTPTEEVRVKVEPPFCDGESPEDLRKEDSSKESDGNEDDEDDPSLLATALCEPVIEAQNEDKPEATTKVELASTNQDLDLLCYDEPQQQRYCSKMI